MYPAIHRAVSRGYEFGRPGHSPGRKVVNLCSP